MAEVESKTILGKMVREALLGGVRVKAGMMRDRHVKVCKKSITDGENSKNKGPEAGKEQDYINIKIWILFLVLRESSR